MNAWIVLARIYLVLAEDWARSADHTQTAVRFSSRFVAVAIRRRGAEELPITEMDFYSHFDYKVWGPQISDRGSYVFHSLVE